MKARKHHISIDKLDVKILLSTFNGELFLKEQLDSLLNQNYLSHKICIRDDGSQDKTVEILKHYKQRFPEKIELIDLNRCVNLGVKDSFEFLLKSVEADYYFFCDQDDIWCPDKISTLMESLYNEERNSPDLPLLVLSDFRIFSDDKGVLVNSYYKEINFIPSDIKNKFFKCLIPGCCFGFNRPAKELYFKYSTEYLHDGHLILLIQLFGKILSTNKKLIDYRVHKNNVVGYWKKSDRLLLIRDFLKYLTNKDSYRRLLLSDYDSNSKMLYKQIDNKFLKENEIYLLSELNNLSFISRKRWYVKHFKPFKKGLYQGILEVLTF